MENDKFFYLASGSPRRRELLSSAGQNFKVYKSSFEEVADKTLTPEETVKYFAYKKAEDVFLKTNKPCLGADTVVVFNGKIIGKPHSDEEAVKILKELSGNMHEVITGVAVVKKDKTIKDVVSTKVYFNDLTDEFINGYVLSGKASDKAGAYGIQDGGFAKSIEGSLTNVVGLPMERTEELLKEVDLWQQIK